MLLEKLHGYKIYLVSQSPRRRALMQDMDIDFEILNVEVEETYNPELPPEQVVQFLSRLKLSGIDIAAQNDNAIFIACDTIVVAGGKIIGKPRDKADALAMLQTLSGRTHTVYSGLTVATNRRTLTDYRSTEVTFARLTEEELEYYVNRYKPLDKAGAYGVQEWIGCIGIRAISGSFYNVMGLPTRLLWEMLDEITE